MTRVSAAYAALPPLVVTKVSGVSSGTVSAGSGASSVAISDAMSSEDTRSDTRASEPLETEALLRSALTKNDALLREAQELEEITDFYLLPASANENLSECVFNLDYIATLFDANIDAHVHEELHETLSDATKRFHKCHTKVHTSWVKKLFLSVEQNIALKERIEQAGKLLMCLEQICKDVGHIREEIEWIRTPILTASSSEEEYTEIFVLPEKSCETLLAQIERYISEHIRTIGVVQEGIEKYIEQTEKFLSLDENMPPKPGLLERASLILTAIPGLLGGLGTLIAYILGATSILTLIPLAVGGIGSGIALLFLVLNLSKFSPAEKIQQLTEEREELNKFVFKPILDLLKKATKMSGVSGTSPNLSDSPVTFFGAYTLNKKNTDPIKEDTTAILDALNLQNNELQTIKANQQKLAQDVAPLLARQRTLSAGSSSSAHSSSSADSQASTLVGSAGVSRTGSPDLIPKSEVQEIVDKALKVQEEKHAKDITGLNTKLDRILAALGNA